MYMGVGLALAVSVAAAACGNETTRIENNGEDTPTGITVGGQGTATAPPDTATITLGVSALAETVAAARDEAAAALTAMIDSMRANGIAEDDIQTQNLSIYPEYDFRDDQQVLRGFRVSNTVTAILRDIDITSKVVDDAVAAGGDSTQIESLVFGIDDPEQLQKEAREKAVADARQRAETLASAGGVSLGEPRSITETSYQPPVIYETSGRAAADTAQPVPSTPIEPGELDVIIDVTVTFAIE
jgi:uncharacterized protein YggE